MQTENPKTKSSSNLLFIVSTLIIVILIAVGLYYLFINTSLTGNINAPLKKSLSVPFTLDKSQWRTYTNSTFHFSFNYPPNMSGNEFQPVKMPAKVGDSSKILLLSTQMQPNTKSPSFNKITFLVYKTTLKMNLFTWIKDRTSISTPSALLTTDTIARQDAAILNFTPSQTPNNLLSAYSADTDLSKIQKIRVIYFKKDDLVYEIRIEAGTQPDEFLITTGEILDSFKFN